MIKLYTVSSLKKIFPDDFDYVVEKEGECFLREIFNFQLVIVSDFEGELSLGAETDLSLRFYGQKFVRGTPAPQKGDGYYLAGKTEFPDPLIPLNGRTKVEKGKNTAIWVSCAADKAGEHLISLFVGNEKVSYCLKIFDDKTKTRDFPITNWIHIDCICDKHNVEPFTKEFYEIFEKYLDLYILGGNTMILTPVFTPPLDTKIGTYRRTCQLVRIKKTKGRYFFDFEKLGYFMAFCRKKGIQYFEFAHLLSQWNGRFCPKIEDENGNLLFGWSSRSGSKKYKRFLRYYLTEIKAFLKRYHYEDVSFFHLGDEPSCRFLGDYIRTSKFVYKYIDKARTIDAVSIPELYDFPALNVPVIATVSYRRSDRMPRNWFLYYACNGNDRMLTNRFMYFPLQRVRVLGYQLYLLQASGFLHWGFNFYYTRYSLEKINPYEVTDAGGDFPSGDSFIVYPSEDGVVPSVRLFVMREAIQDFYALKRLEELYGKEFALNLLKENGMEGLSVYGTNIEWHIALRRKINRYIVERGKNI